MVDCRSGATSEMHTVTVPGSSVESQRNQSAGFTGLPPRVRSREMMP
jgi:hypothetical protein